MASLLYHVKFIIAIFMVLMCNAKKHHLELKGDSRKFFPITTFGFYRNGYLSVDVSKFKIYPGIDSEELIGFSLEKTANPYTDNHPEECALNHLQEHDALVQRVLLTFDLANSKVTARCSEDMRDLHIFEDMRPVMKYAKQSQPGKFADTTLFSNPQRRKATGSPASASSGEDTPDGSSPMRRRKRQAPPEAPSASLISAEGGAAAVTSGPTVAAAGGVVSADDGHINVPEVKCNNVSLPISLKDGYYNFSFVVYVASKKEEGLYNLIFHNCHNYDITKQRSSIDMDLMVIELNPDDNYLSAGDMPLPALYFMMALLFMLSAAFWFFLLKKSKEPVFKIHYLMGVLVVIKSLSLLFHAINYHFIQIQGTHMEAWAVMYYIMHLLKGALLFTVLALIGSGWAFIKHILSSKEKKIFMLVIPMQIIANVASIIIEETDEWDPKHAVWMRLLFLLDFLCCAAILLPVVWSIRHLQEASQTDGKAAMNLSKLKLFRHFYIMVVCYIYFTRIIVYLLGITVPFRYSWLDDMFREMATYVFFVLTGYKFRPANNNPYFLLGIGDDDDDEDVVLTTTGLTENVSRVNQHDGGKHLRGVTVTTNMGGSYSLNSSSGDVMSTVRSTALRSSSSTESLLTEVVQYEDQSELNSPLLPSKEDSHDLD